MPKYEVTMNQTINETYKVEVEAGSEQEAIDMAEEMRANCDIDPIHQSCTHGNVEVTLMAEKNAE